MNKRLIKEILSAEFIVSTVTFLFSLGIAFIGFVIGFVEDFDCNVGITYFIKTLLVTFAISFVACSILNALYLYTEDFERKINRK